MPPLSLKRLPIAGACISSPLPPFYPGPGLDFRLRVGGGAGSRRAVSQRCGVLCRPRSLSRPVMRPKQEGQITQAAGQSGHSVGPPTHAVFRQRIYLGRTTCSRASSCTRSNPTRRQGRQRIADPNGKHLFVAFATPSARPGQALSPTFGRARATARQFRTLVRPGLQSLGLGHRFRRLRRRRGSSPAVRPRLACWP